jgi:PAT family beta-lactamase induction signal transducer AmpG
MTTDAPGRTARPVVFLFLNLPYGVSSGFATITLPFILTRAGFSVAAAAAVTALALLPSTWRFLWAPITDLTWTLHRWTIAGVAVCTLTMAAFGLVPVRPDNLTLVTAMALVTQIGGQLAMVPVGGLMALTVDEAEKGRAGGWFMAGNLGGGGLGGGAGIWLVAHGSVLLAMLVLAGVILASALALLWVPAVARGTAGETLGARVRSVGRDFRHLFGSARSLLVVVRVMSPVGVGALGNVWAGLGSSWHATPDQVALATGLLNGVACGLGSAFGGWLADRAGGWWAYLGAGVALGLFTLAWAGMARTPAVYICGIAAFSAIQGVNYAGYAAIVLYTIGGGAAATKYSILTSLGNLPVSYMTALVGRAHGRWGTGGALFVDALSGLAAVPLLLAGLWLVRRRERAAAAS